MKRIAVVRIRGKVGVKKDVNDTTKMLRLYNKHTCVILNNDPQHLGMLEKLKNHVTWGEIEENTFKLLLERRGRLPNKQQLTDGYVKEKLGIGLEQFAKEFLEFKRSLKDIPGLKQFFKLIPPEKGFEKKGIKFQFSLGGALGYRKEKINELLVRMI